MASLKTGSQSAPRFEELWTTDPDIAWVTANEELSISGEAQGNQNTQSIDARPEEEVITTSDAIQIDPISAFENVLPGLQSKRQRRLANIKGEIGSDDLPKGTIRSTVAGQMDYLDNGNWSTAVYHDDLRDILIEEMNSQGQYLHPRAKGKGTRQNDITCYHPDQAAWGTKRENWPKILFQFKKDEHQPPSYRAGKWMHEGRVVLDSDNHPVLNYPEIPKTCSSDMEGCIMEAIRRENPNITHKDFRARMPYFRTQEPSEKGKSFSLNAIGMRMTRFRRQAGCIAWNKRAGSSAVNAYLESLHPESCLQANSIEASYLLKKEQINEMTALNKGKFPEKAKPNRKRKATMEVNADIDSAPAKRTRISNKQGSSQFVLPENPDILAGSHSKDETSPPVEQPSAMAKESALKSKSNDIKVNVGLFSNKQNRSAPQQVLENQYTSFETSSARNNASLRSSSQNTSYNPTSAEGIHLYPLFPKYVDTDLRNRLPPYSQVDQQRPNAHSFPGQQHSLDAVADEFKDKGYTHRSTIPEIRIRRQIPRTTQPSIQSQILVYHTQRSRANAVNALNHSAITMRNASSTLSPFSNFSNTSSIAHSSIKSTQPTFSGLDPLLDPQLAGIQAQIKEKMRAEVRREMEEEVCAEVRREMGTPNFTSQQLRASHAHSKTNASQQHFFDRHGVQQQGLSQPCSPHFDHSTTRSDVSESLFMPHNANCETSVKHMRGIESALPFAPYQDQSRTNKFSFADQFIDFESNDEMNHAQQSSTSASNGMQTINPIDFEVQNNNDMHDLVNLLEPVHQFNQSTMQQDTHPTERTAQNDVLSSMPAQNELSDYNLLVEQWPNSNPDTEIFANKVPTSAHIYQSQVDQSEPLSEIVRFRSFDAMMRK